MEILDFDISAVSNQLTCHGHLGLIFLITRMTTSTSNDGCDYHDYDDNEPKDTANLLSSLSSSCLKLSQLDLPGKLQNSIELPTRPAGLAWDDCCLPSLLSLRQLTSLDISMCKISTISLVQVVSILIVILSTGVNWPAQPEEGRMYIWKAKQAALGPQCRPLLLQAKDHPPDLQTASKVTSDSKHCFHRPPRYLGYSHLPRV